MAQVKEPWSEPEVGRITSTPIALDYLITAQLCRPVPGRRAGMRGVMRRILSGSTEPPGRGS